MEKTETVTSVANIHAFHSQWIWVLNQRWKHYICSNLKRRARQHLLTILLVTATGHRALNEHNSLRLSPLHVNPLNELKSSARWLVLTGWLREWWESPEKQVTCGPPTTDTYCILEPFRTYNTWAKWPDHPYLPTQSVSQQWGFQHGTHEQWSTPVLSALQCWLCQEFPQWMLRIPHTLNRSKWLFNNPLQWSTNTSFHLLIWNNKWTLEDSLHNFTAAIQ